MNYDTLNPGIREVVRRLREAGFQTCDSGDGSTRQFECDPGAPDVTTPALMYAAEPTVYGFENRPGDGYYALLTNGTERLATEGEASLGRQSQVDATDYQSKSGGTDA